MPKLKRRQFIEALQKYDIEFSPDETIVELKKKLRDWINTKVEAFCRICCSTFLCDETMRMNNPLYLEIWKHSGSFLNTLED